MKRLSILLPAVALALLGADDLELRTQALLQRRCLACHGPRTRTAGLDLSTREGALKGGVSGAALKPGSANESLLLSRVLKDQMPPSGPLPQEEKQLLQQWIESGAPWTRIVAEQRAGLDWWSLQPLGKHAAPTVEGAPPL